MPRSTRRTRYGMDVFRPIASAASAASAVAAGGGCGGIKRGGGDGEKSFCTIFRRGNGGLASSGLNSRTCSSDDSFVLSLPGRQAAWPPPAIPGSSESADTKDTKSLDDRQLDRSIPIREDSNDDDYHHKGKRGSARSKSLTSARKPPSYYKIEVQGNQVFLSAGEDNSVAISPDHNARIKSTKQDNCRIIARALPISDPTAEPHSSPQPLVCKSKQQWTVSNRGVICPLDTTTTKTTAATTTSIPLLAKASTDSSNSVTSDNKEFLLESPPRMSRSVVSSSLFQDHKPSSTHNLPDSDNDNHQHNHTHHQQQCKSRTDTFSKMLDFFSTTCCQATIYKNTCPSSTQLSTVSAM